MSRPAVVWSRSRSQGVSATAPSRTSTFRVAAPKVGPANVSRDTRGPSERDPTDQGCGFFAVSADLMAMSDEGVRQVLGLLHQEDTLKVLAALVLDVPVEEVGLDRDGVRRALDRLGRGGLVMRGDDGALAVRRERFRELLHATAAPVPAVSPEERVLRSFLVDGRLRAIPTKHAKRLIVLNHIARFFEPGVRYAEKEVDVTLRAFHDDHATLRRYLIDEGLLSRKDNVYWRSGGPVDV